MLGRSRPTVRLTFASVATIFVVLLTLSISLKGQLSAQDPRFVPGEALVKFTAGSPGEAGVIQSSRMDPPDLRVLDPILRGLESSLLLPLQAVRVSSGNWLLLSVDRERLRERAIERLHGRSGIADLQPLSQERDELGPVAFAVKFAPATNEYKMLAAPKPEDRAAAVSKLLVGLKQAVGLPLKGGLATDGVMEFGVDMIELTHILASRLAQAPQVEAANLNYILGAIGGCNEPNS